MRLNKKTKIKIVLELNELERGMLEQSLYMTKNHLHGFHDAWYVAQTLWIKVSTANSNAVKLATGETEEAEI